VIWLGDLNYRIALSYSEATKLVEANDWGTLFEKDQVNKLICIAYCVKKRLRVLQVFIWLSELNSSRLKGRVEFSEGGMRARSSLLQHTSTHGIPIAMQARMPCPRRREEHRHGMSFDNTYTVSKYSAN
jgi:hypothetical protein